MATRAGTNLNDPGGPANLLTLPDIGGLVETVGTGTPTAFLPPGTLPYPDVGGPSKIRSPGSRSHAVPCMRPPCPPVAALRHG